MAYVPDDQARALTPTVDPAIGCTAPYLYLKARCKTADVVEVRIGSAVTG